MDLPDRQCIRVAWIFDVMVGLVVNTLYQHTHMLAYLRSSVLPSYALSELAIISRLESALWHHADLLDT